MFAISILVLEASKGWDYHYKQQSFLKDIEKKTHNLRVNLNICVVVFEQKAEKQNILSKARKYFVQSHTFIYF